MACVSSSSSSRCTGSYRCVPLHCPSSQQACRSLIPYSCSARSTSQRRRSGLTSFPAPHPAVPASLSTAPPLALSVAHSPSPIPSAAWLGLGSVNTNGHNHVTMRRWNSRKLNTNGSRHTCRCSAATSAFRTSRCSTPSCMSPSMAANGAGYPHGLATGTPSTPA